MAGASLSQLRRFGLTVGGAFLLLGLLLWWNGRTLPPRVLGAAGGLLWLAALLAPRGLAPVERAWMRGAQALGTLNGRILLTLLFFLVVWPVGRIVRLFRDPLDRALGEDRRSTWIRRPPTPVDPARYERQF